MTEQSQFGSGPRRRRKLRQHPVTWAMLLVLIVAGVLFWWWSLGYRADNCHEDDMGRGQQWICDILSPGGGR